MARRGDGLYLGTHMKAILRERVLTPEEVQRFMEGVARLPPKPGAYLLTLLLTAARLSEVRGMRWADVEWSTRLWKKPRPDMLDNQGGQHENCRDRRGLPVSEWVHDLRRQFNPSQCDCRIAVAECKRSATAGG